MIMSDKSLKIRWLRTAQHNLIQNSIGDFRSQDFISDGILLRHKRDRKVAIDRWNSRRSSRFLRLILASNPTCSLI